MKKYRPGTLCQCGSHVWAKATKGFVVLVSPSDRCLLDEYVWTTKLTKRNAYAFRSERDKEGALHNFYIHHSIIYRSEGEEIDHLNRNGMDNRRINLRSVAHRANVLNSKKKFGATSRFKGVYKKSGRSKWTAELKIGGAVRYLGNFDTEEEAFECASASAMAEHGENWRP